MLPVKKPTRHYHTLEEIRLRKEELASQIQQDNTKFSALWNQTFVKREGSSKGEYISGLIANSITAIDAFLLIRKLMKNYGSLFGKTSKKSKKSPNLLVNFIIGGTILKPSGTPPNIANIHILSRFWGIP